jgi:hypothetical membrane protein
MMIRKLSEQHTPWLGMAAAGLIAAGALVAALGFRHEGGEPYSFLRQNISDLGDPQVSAWAFVFNYSLVAGSIIMALFIAGVSVVASTRSTYVIAGIGIIATIAMAFVGVYPSSPPTAFEHKVSAGIAFLGTLGLGASFTLRMLLRPHPVLPRWLILPGILSAASALGFLFTLAGSWRGYIPASMLHWRGGTLPEIHLVSLLEWCVLFSILAWSFLTALSLRRVQKVD